MIQLISAGKSTKLHTFPELLTTDSYSHYSNEIQDVYFHPTKNVFLSINKTIGFEILRTNESAGGSNFIQRLKKRKLGNLMCGSIGNNGDIALGLNTGGILFFNLYSAEFSEVRFKTEKIGSSVVYLGYNNNDELLASVYDNGDINLYGMNTMIKMDTFKLDQNSTLLRFHPTKRFHMAVASYLGAVTVFDIQSKKIQFQSKSAHNAPCPDLFWSPASNDMLITVGYDSKMNIFDIRHNKSGIFSQQIINEYPFSSVAMSNCGQFIGAGNLNGDIISYDIRNLKKPLTKQETNCNAGPIVRIGFITKIDSNAEILKLEECEIERRLSVASNRQSIAIESPGIATGGGGGGTISDTGPKHDDSFISFYNKCLIKRKDSICRRDSILDLEIKPLTFNDISDTSIESFKNMDSKKLLTNLTPKQQQQLRYDENDSNNLNNNKSELVDDVFLEEVRNVPPSISHISTRRKYKGSFPEIQETSIIYKDIINTTPNILISSPNLTDTPPIRTPTTNRNSIIIGQENKENNLKNRMSVDHFNNFIKLNASTPNQLKEKLNIHIKAANTAEGLVGAGAFGGSAAGVGGCGGDNGVGGDDAIGELCDGGDGINATAFYNINQNVGTNSNCCCSIKLTELEHKIDRKFESLESSIVNRTSHLLSAILANIWTMERTTMKDIYDAVSMVARGDDFVQGYVDTIEELERLREIVNRRN